MSSIGTRICIWSIHSPPTRMPYGNISGWPMAQSSFSSVCPSSTRRLMMPYSNSSKATLTCFFWNDFGRVEALVVWPRNSK